MKKGKDNTLPFVLVPDKILAERLKNQGFVCVNETDTMYTFINNRKLIFDGSIDEHKVIYTNKLCVYTSYYFS